MKQFFFIILASICFQFVLYSCHALVEDEFGELDKVPVLNSILQADSIIKVQLSLSTKLNETSPAFIDNALVIITDNQGKNDTLFYTQEGWYKSNTTAIAGVNYSCNIIIPGYDTVSAFATIPMPTEMSDIKFTDMVGRDEEGEKISSFEFLIANNKAQNMYWRVVLTDVVSSNGNEVYTSFERIYMVPDQDSVLLNEAQPLTLFSNIMMKHNHYKVKFYLSQSGTQFGERKNAKAYVTLYTVDESYFNYMKRYFIYYTTFTPTIGQSPQNYHLYSNVKNGLGLFSGMSATKKQVVFED